VVYGFAAAVQPGPFLAFLISLALSCGWRRALPGVLAPLLSDGLIIVLVCGCAGRRDHRLNRLLSGVSGVALAAFGLHQIALGIMSWR